MPRKKFQPTGVLAERTDSLGRRRIALTNEERRLFQRRELVERAVVAYLDLEHDYTAKQIAEELGLTVEELKTLTRSDEFQEMYNAYFLELGHDPRLQATKAAIVDLLPAAMRQLRSIITGGEHIPYTVKLKAIEDVLKLAGIEQDKPARNDKRELAAFLQQAGVNIENVNIVTGQLPPEYSDPLAFSHDEDVEEGEFRPEIQVSDQN